MEELFYQYNLAVRSLERFYAILLSLGFYVNLKNEILDLLFSDLESAYEEVE